MNVTRLSYYSQSSLTGHPFSFFFFPVVNIPNTFTGANYCGPYASGLKDGTEVQLSLFFFLKGDSALSQDFGLFDICSRVSSHRQPTEEAVP